MELVLCPLCKAPESKFGCMAVCLTVAGLMRGAPEAPTPCLWPSLCRFIPRLFRVLFGDMQICCFLMLPATAAAACGLCPLCFWQWSRVGSGVKSRREMGRVATPSTGCGLVAVSGSQQTSLLKATAIFPPSAHSLQFPQQTRQELAMKSSQGLLGHLSNFF